MKITAIRLAYYSAAGSTKAVLQHFAARLSEKLGAPVTEDYDFTLPAARTGVHSYAAGELLIAGTPVYAGRIPNKLLPFWQSAFEGNGALAIPVVTFGNRNFDNGLIELRNELEAHGFKTAAGAGIACRHVFSQVLAAGRPDAQDYALLDEFADKAAAKILALACAPEAPIAVRGDDPVGPYYTPKGTDGKPAVFLKAKPKCDSEKCTACGKCAAVCPMGSFSAEQAGLCTGLCIKCQACIKACPAGALYFDDAAFLSHVAMLEQNFMRRAEPEFFL